MRHCSRANGCSTPTGKQRGPRTMLIRSSAALVSGPPLLLVGTLSHSRTRAFSLKHAPAHAPAHPNMDPHTRTCTRFPTTARIPMPHSLHPSNRTCVCAGHVAWIFWRVQGHASRGVQVPVAAAVECTHYVAINVFRF